MYRLIEKARKGDDMAFLQLFQTYEIDIYRMGYTYVGNKEDALEVVQETAYKSFKAIQTLKNPTYFKTWLLKIAINCSLDILRKRKKKNDFNEDEIVHENFAEHLPEVFDLQQCIDYLSPDEKSVILLRFYEDLTIKEVANLLEIPLGTAKTILYRSLQKMRQQLQEGGSYV